MFTPDSYKSFAQDSTADRALIETEAKEIGAFFRAYTTILMQVATALAIADVTILTVGFSAQVAAAFWLGAIVILILLSAWIACFRGFVPLYLRAIVLEMEMSKLNGSNNYSTVTLGILAFHGPQVLEDLRSIVNITDQAVLSTRMRRLGYRMAFVKGSTVTATAVLILVAAGHIALGFFARTQGWDLF